MSDQSVATHSGDETRQTGRLLAAQLRPGDILLLHGDLGAGKTTFTQGLLAGLRVASPVNSPTFILVAEHHGTLPSGEPVLIRHADLYRIEDPDQLESTGYFDLIHNPEGIAVIEWPERAAAHLPDQYILVTLEFKGPQTRQITLIDNSGSNRRLVLSAR
ncbi:MAG: tRNA (adenosine(37)-N6)-threonylcarbamoyltransferase complex ATPase subunit type 1 TsaE [Thermomicrobiales bacterium]